MIIKLLLTLAAVLPILPGSFGPVAATRPAPPPAVVGGGTENGLDIKINCSQGQIDQDHRVTVTVQNGDQEHTVTQYLPAQGTIDDVSNGLASKLGRKIEGDVGVTGEGLERKLTLPEGWKVKEVTTEKKVGKKWKERDGHLRVRSFSKKAGTPGPVSGFSSFDLILSEGNADPIAVDLTVHAVRPNGLERDVHYLVTYPSETTTQEALEGVEQFLEDLLGCDAELVDPTTLRVYPNDGFAAITAVYFGAFEDNDHEDVTNPDADLPGWDTQTSIVVQP